MSDNSDDPNKSKPPKVDDQVIDENLSDEDLDALLSADIKSSSRPPINPFRETEESSDHSSLLSELTESDESDEDEVVDYFGEGDEPEPMVLELEEVDEEPSFASTGSSSSSVSQSEPVESVDFGFEYEAPEQDTQEFEVPVELLKKSASGEDENLQIDLEDYTPYQNSVDDQTDVRDTTELLKTLGEELPEQEVPKFIDDTLGTEESNSPDPVHSPDSQQANSSVQSEPVVSSEPEIKTAPTAVARSVSVLSVNKVTVQAKPISNPTVSTKGNNNMSVQESQIEKILSAIDELKRKLHGMNSDFYNAATESAALISEVRELEVSSSDAQDFTATYTQSRELRKNLVESRKAFNVLASAIDELEEALESDLYAVQKNS